MKPMVVTILNNTDTETFMTITANHILSGSWVWMLTKDPGPTTMSTKPQTTITITLTTSRVNVTLPITISSTGGCGPDSSRTRHLENELLLIPLSGEARVLD